MKILEPDSQNQWTLNDLTDYLRKWWFDWGGEGNKVYLTFYRAEKMRQIIIPVRMKDWKKNVYIPFMLTNNRKVIIDKEYFE